MRRVCGWFIGCVLFFTLPASAADKSKDEETLRNAEAVLKAMLDSNSLPMEVLKKAQCVMVLPGVKKFGVGIGGSGGRGPLSCRSASGKWSAPAMFTISGVSAGLQVGGSSTDYVMLVMTQKGVDAMLKGKSKLGNEMTAAAGPSGATKSHDIGSDVLTYGRAKGLFAGTSLGNATIEADKDANKRLYGKDVSVEQLVVQNSEPVPAGAKPLNELLSSKAAGKAAEPGRSKTKS